MKRTVLCAAKQLNAKHVCPKITLKSAVPVCRVPQRQYTMYSFLGNMIKNEGKTFETNTKKDPMQFTLERLDQGWIDSNYPVIEVESETAKCDGTQFTNLEARLGHPVEYIRVNGKEPVRCAYCSLRFIRVPKGQKRKQELPSFADPSKIDDAEGGGGHH